MDKPYIEAGRLIRERAGGIAPKVALVLGSGLADVLETLDVQTRIDYAELPGFAPPSVAGHRGELMIGTLAGVPLMVMRGRMHYYEGHSASALANPIRALKVAGANTLLLTNAAGSLRENMPPGSLMMIEDHINFAGVSPMRGPNDDAMGERFFDITEAYDRALRAQLQRAAAAIDVTLDRGVYLMCSGPHFETPAEIRAFRQWGADAVGMSTVPECLVARHCGMRVAGVSTITNLAAGMTGEALSHAETLSEGAKAASKMAALLEKFVGHLDND